jgi:hypothetical protein
VAGVHDGEHAARIDGDPGRRLQWVELAVRLPDQFDRARGHLGRRRPGSEQTRLEPGIERRHLLGDSLLRGGARPCWGAGGARRSAGGQRGAERTQEERPTG